MDVVAFLSNTASYSGRRGSPDFAKKDKKKRRKQQESARLWEARGIPLDGVDAADGVHAVNVTKARVGGTLWKALVRNGTLYVRFHVTRAGASPDPSAPGYAGAAQTYALTAPLVRWMPKLAAQARVTRELVPSWRNARARAASARAKARAEASVPASAPKAARGASEVPVGAPLGYWVPRATAFYVADWTRWPHHRGVPFLRHMRLLRTGGGAGGAGPAYSPLLSAHQLGLTREKLV